MESKLIGSNEIIDSKMKTRIILSDNELVNKRNRDFARRIESPYQLARRTLKLYEVGGLKEYYSRELLEDLIENRAIDIKSFNKIKSYNFETLAGFAFESFVVRRVNAYDEIKKNLLDWIINNENPKPIKYDEILAISIGGTTTKAIYPDLYSFTNPNIDIMFINPHEKRYPPLIDQYNRYAGIQVKAVKTNYKKQVVEKVLQFHCMSNAIGSKVYDSSRHPIYRRVLTLLKDDSGIHSSNVCKDIIYKDYRDVLSKKEIEEAIDCIKSPEEIGLDQHEIDYYYNLIKNWHIRPTDFKLNALNTEMIDSLKALEVSIENYNNRLPLKKHIIFPN